VVWETHPEGPDGECGLTDGVGAEGRVRRLEDALGRERERVRALEEVGVALGATLDLRELLRVVLDSVTRAMAADRSTLYLVDDETGELWSEVAQGESRERFRVRVGEGIAGWVAQHGRPLRVSDAYRDVRFDADWDRRTGYRTKTILAVPLRNHHGRIVGVVQSLNKRGADFTAEDEALLVALASQAAVSIENSKLFLSIVNKNAELLETQDRLERKVRELDVLFEIAQVSAGAHRFDELLEGVLARAIRAVDAAAASVTVDEEAPHRTPELVYRAASVGGVGQISKLPLGEGEGIGGWVARHQRPQVIADVDFDDRFSRRVAELTGYHPRTVLAVPLAWEGGRGALELIDKGRDAHGVFTDDDVKLATMIAGHVSTAIGLAASRERRAREDRLSTVGRFLSSMLHDLRTPLTVITGYLRLLAGEDDRGEREAFVDASLRQVAFIDTMTKETLAFARGERTLLERKTYLGPFFAEVVEQLRRDLADRGVQVELDLRERGIAWFDPEKIQRAVFNLARNAAEAIGESGGTFRIRVERQDDGGDTLVLTFEDDGPGIPAEIQPRLFESFTSHGKKGGTGLGLAVVRRIVDEHRGEVRVKSDASGTTFRVSLPAALRAEQFPGRDRISEP
jgi:signal transduction histidine kinase/putative methionine-R-sulfoxide reductase with GAF domain